MSLLEDKPVMSVDGSLAQAPSSPRRPPWPDPRRAARRVWWWTVGVVDLTLLPLALTQKTLVASLITMLVAVLARHDGVVSVLGRRTARAGGYRRHQLVYHLGQLHRAMAMSAVGWLVIAAVTTTDLWLSAIVGGVVFALCTMVWTARDAARGYRHERFETVHRYLGWSVLGVLVGVVGGTYGIALAEGQPGRGLAPVVLLSAVVTLVAHPWTGVRRLPVEVLDVTASLVVLALPGRRRVGEFLRVSLDGHEWHAFAVSTCGREGPDRFCLVIRRAGDWTDRLGRLCANGEAPTALLVRRLRGYGFMGHAQAYRNVLVVATGAGIGPVLLYLLDRHQPGLRCLWIARDHRAAMGVELVDRVLAGGQTTLVDTAVGRPSLPDLITRHGSGVDAVFVVSNAAVRDEVARICTDRGLRWYGPTFDS